MKLERKYITPLIALIFLVLAITGLFMFFHLFDGYTEVAHELMGLAFVAAAAFHILVNWPSLKTHFAKKVFMPAALAILWLTAAFVISERMHLPIDQVLMTALIKAPLDDSFKALGIDYKEASKKLQAEGISLKEAKTLEDIWIKNEADPEEVINLLMNN